jgi:hypothetical protein
VRRIITGLFLAAVAAGMASSAQAHTSENVLFVCEGVLEGDHRGYSITDKISEEYNPMFCDIDDKVVRQVLKVCRVGKSCIVSGKGEQGNGGSHLIQKVFEAQFAPWLDDTGAADYPLNKVEDSMKLSVERMLAI